MPRTVLHRHAYQHGHDLGHAARAQHPGADPPVVSTLEAYGFEPRLEGADVTLGNCPFDSLAQDYTALVCGMNLSLLTGLLHGLGSTHLNARLNPAPGRCCVRLTHSRLHDPTITSP